MITNYGEDISNHLPQSRTWIRFEKSFYIVIVMALIKYAYVYIMYILHYSMLIFPIFGTSSLSQNGHHLD